MSGRDPGAVLAGPGRACAGGDDLRESRVGAQRPRALAAAGAESRRQFEACGLEDHPRVRSPPQDGLASPKPREDSVPVGIQQARRAQVAAHREQAIGLAQRALHGRECRVRVRIEQGDRAGGSRKGLCLQDRVTIAQDRAALLARTRRAMASANRGSATQCRLWVISGRKPRAILCSPCAPGSKRVQAFAQAIFDALVVTGLEMQAGHRFAGAPVAAIKRVAAAQAQRAGDRLARRAAASTSTTAAACARPGGG